MAKRTKIEPGSHDLLVDLDKGKTLDDVTYGRWTERKDGRYYVPSLLSGSDYSGDLVQQSNARAWEEKFEGGQDVWWTNASGGHGTFAVVVDLEGVPEDREEDVREFLSRLEDYPVADDDLHSKMEMEAQDEAWDDWARRDFVRAIEKRLGEDFEGDVDEDLLRTVFDETGDGIGECWRNEQGDSMWIDVSKIARKVDEESLRQLVASVKPWE